MSKGLTISTVSANTTFPQKSVRGFGADSLDQGGLVYSTMLTCPRGGSEAVTSMGLPCLSAEAGQQHEVHAQLSADLEVPKCTQQPDEDDDRTFPRKHSKEGEVQE